MLDEDSLDYDVLRRAALNTVNVAGMACEIGVRRGGSIQHIFTAWKSSGKTVVAVDPYGDIAYNATDTITKRYDYTNAMKHNSMAQIYALAATSGINLIFFNLEDTEFFARFANGVPVYDVEKTINKVYSLVFFDGPHDTTSILTEVEWFASRSVLGAYWVFDDIATYDHNTVENRVLELGFTLVETGIHGRKKSYIKGK
tara:strand:+ start:509 stop:1108 length:600 start_codon:yes stop_codon:yes gene_type:complete